MKTLKRSLVDIARQQETVRTHSVVTLWNSRESFDLAMAFMRGEITVQQATLALGWPRSHTSKTVYMFAKALKFGAEQGWWQP